MDETGRSDVVPKTRSRLTERQFNTAVFLRRCVSVGFTMTDIDRLDFGTLTDVMIEAGNDNETYDYIATQADFDNF